MKTVIVALTLFANLFAQGREAQQPDHIQLSLDSSEAEAVLAILNLRAGKQTVAEGDWRMVFSTIPYQRLKKRESSLWRDFTEDDFRRFVVTLDARRGQLRQTLDFWKKADLVAIAQLPLRYLPGDAALHAAVYLQPRCAIPAKDRDIA